MKTKQNRYPQGMRETRGDRDRSANFECPFNLGLTLSHINKLHIWKVKLSHKHEDKACSLMGRLPSQCDPLYTPWMD